jgi:ATP-dependent protease Clp ATPase subunit
MPFPPLPLPPPPPPPPHTHTQVDTKDILFIVGGAFIDLERQVMDSRHTASIGFGNKVSEGWGGWGGGGE